LPDGIRRSQSDSLIQGNPHLGHSLMHRPWGELRLQLGPTSLGIGHFHIG
jgi:hypothetical protein